MQQLDTAVRHIITVSLQPTCNIVQIAIIVKRYFQNLNGHVIEFAC